MEQFIEKVQKTRDMKLFRSFISSLNDINGYLIKNEDNSMNLLHICIAFEESQFSLDCIELLLSISTININCLAKIERTLGMSGAHIAVDWSHHKALQTLIDHRIDLTVCNSHGLSANEYARQRANEEGRLIIERAIHNYSPFNSYSFGLLDTNDLIKSDSVVNEKSHFKVKELSHKFSPKCIKDKDSDETVEYFDENQNIWQTIDKQKEDSYDSENNSRNSLISNISYERTESVKSFCSDKTEIYVYKDRDHNVVLIEERFEGCVHNSGSDLSLSERQTISKGCATQTIADKYVKEIELMNGTQIFNKLQAMGDSPGPILPSTKILYQKRLLGFQMGTLSPIKQVLPLPTHSLELNLLLQNNFPFDKVLKLEKQFIDFFEENNCKQNNFNYLLMDPNIGQNIPLEANSTKIVVNCCAQIETNLFVKFIKSIFYVGKGQANRVYQHFYEAIKSDGNQQMCPKVKRIHEIWSSNKGVISLHCFQSISSYEALARETVIIEALDISNLTNQINGQYIRGLKWNERKRRLFGSYLLFKSFGIYVLTGERQIRRPIS